MTQTTQWPSTADPAAAPERAIGGDVSLGPDECREANRWWTVSRSVTNVAHDLNNVLQLISGNVEMLQRRSGLDAEVQRRLASVAAQAARAVTTMAPLIDYARDSSPAVQSVDLRTLAPVALSLRSVSLGRGGVRTSIAVSGDDDLRIDGAPGAVLQLLLNLLLRAEREVYGRAGAQLTVSVARSGDAVVAAVEASSEAADAETVCEPTVADRLSASATAELLHAVRATLSVDEHRGRCRLVVTAPAAAAP